MNHQHRPKRPDLTRLMRPRSIAVVGGGAWCQQVLRQLRLVGFSGDVFRVHPNPAAVEGISAVSSIQELPYGPDAVFIGVDRNKTIEAISVLSRLESGGAVCFASGFSEAQTEDENSSKLQQELVEAAGDMPILGPNCYGFINAFDGALLWPDQHGCKPVEKGVAIITQSSNIAINLTMQQRELPIGSVVTCGNMAQVSQADIALALLDDPRITAIGLYVEGFGDTHAWHELALKAWSKNVPLVVLKIGASQQARTAAISHTASLAGSDAGAAALLQYLGIPRVYDLPAFLSALMIAHCNGGLETNTLSSISCSGGEASLVADMAEGKNVCFPALTEAQKSDLTTALGSMVSLSNPLDYNTYIWGDRDKMTAAWLPMAAEGVGLVLIILDYPHTDPSAWKSATASAIAVKKRSDRPVAVVSTLPELLPPAIASELLDSGVTPLHGLAEALNAIEALTSRRAPRVPEPLKAILLRMDKALEESASKAMLHSFGISVPRGVISNTQDDLTQAVQWLDAPFVIKIQGVAHKSEQSGVKLNIDKDALVNVVSSMATDTVLIEEMVQGGIAELLVGVTRDPAHGFVLTLAAGGTLTELLRDKASLLLPTSEDDVRAALSTLRIYPLLCGYRAGEAVDMDDVVRSVIAVQECVLAHVDEICEIEVNPLICTATGAIAADALITVATRNEQEEP